MWATKIPINMSVKHRIKYAYRPSHSSQLKLNSNPKNRGMPITKTEWLLEYMKGFWVEIGKC